MKRAPVDSSYAGWTIATVAGTGAAGYAGDGGHAVEAMLNNPFDGSVRANWLEAATVAP